MNKTILTLAIAALSAAAFASDVEKTTTTTATATTDTVGDGTVTEYTPGTAFVVKESSGPIRYRYGKTVTYVTRDGKAISDDEVRTRIKVGSPVHVHYATEGGDRVISRVEVGE